MSFEWDSSVKTKGEYERIYKDFKEQKYDIMIGTIDIMKGFPSFSHDIGRGDVTECGSDY